MPTKRPTVLCSLAVTLLVASASTAGDWPQILGPTRNGVAVGEQIRRQWGQEQPQAVWSRAVGEGYAGVAVVGERVIVFHRTQDQEVVQAWHATTGKPLWRHSWPIRYYGRIDPDTGPRCVPLVDQDAVYLHGVDGHLACLSLSDGRERWSRETRRDFKFLEGYFGVGSSPIVIGDKLLANIGGREEAGVVAFATATGETVWQATEEAASYASPISATIDGRRVALLVTRLQFVGLDPQSGEVLFELPFGKRGPTVNAANPLRIGQRHVLLTASYDIGAKLVRLDARGRTWDAQVVWASDVLASQYATSVPHGEAIYGIDGRADGGSTQLLCLDPLTGRVHWRERDFGMATLIVAGDTLLVMKTDGELVLAEATTHAYRELARFQLVQGTVRALPALADGRLYIRNQQQLACFQVGQSLHR